jgi:hypothetical protein
MTLQETFHAIVTPEIVVGWFLLSVLCVGVLHYDLRANNQGIPRVMQLVWTLTVFYSGPLGLAVYWYSGRSQIPEDTFARRGMRSTASSRWRPASSSPSPSRWPTASASPSPWGR